MSLRYALLGLLAEEPASGYDLTRKFGKALRRYAWHAQHSQIYPELSRLAEDTLIEVAAEGARGRRLYAITDAGRAELRDWLMHPPDAFDVRNEFVLRMFLMSTLDAEEAQTILRPVVERSAQELAELRDILKRYDAINPDEDGRPFGRLAAEYGARSMQALHEWAIWALEYTRPKAKSRKRA